MYREDARCDPHLPDRREILDWIVGHLLVEPGIDCMRRHRRHQQRVTVGGRFRDDIGADVAARAGPVFHHERLSEQVRHSGAHDAGDGVRRTTGRERHHESDRFRGVAVLRDAFIAGKRKAQSKANKSAKLRSAGRHIQTLPGHCAPEEPQQQKARRSFRARAFSFEDGLAVTFRVRKRHTIIGPNPFHCPLRDGNERVQAAVAARWNENEES